MQYLRRHALRVFAYEPMPRLFGFIEIDVEGHEQAVLDGAGQKELAKDNPSASELQPGHQR